MRKTIKITTILFIFSSSILFSFGKTSETIEATSDESSVTKNNDALDKTGLKSYLGTDMSINWPK